MLLYKRIIFVMGSSDSKEEDDLKKQDENEEDKEVVPTNLLINRLRKTMRLKMQEKNNHLTYSFLHQ